ncbi:MAG: hypothetical protein WCP95_06715 [Actinomycetes bacterium]
MSKKTNAPMTPDQLAEEVWEDESPTNYLVRDDDADTQHRPQTDPRDNPRSR